MSSPTTTQTIPRVHSNVTATLIQQVRGSQNPPSNMVKTMQQILTKKDDAAFDEYEEGHKNALKLIEELQKSLQKANTRISVVESENAMLKTQITEAATTHAKSLESAKQTIAEQKKQIERQNTEIARFIRNDKIIEEELDKEETKLRESIKQIPRFPVTPKTKRAVMAETTASLNTILEINKNTSKK